MIFFLKASSNLLAPLVKVYRFIDNEIWFVILLLLQLLFPSYIRTTPPPQPIILDYRTFAWTVLVPLSRKSNKFPRILPQQRKNSAQCKFKADTNAAPVNSIYRWPSINVSRFPIKIRPGRFSCKFEKSIMARRRFYPGRSINREESQSPWLSVRPLVKGCPLSMEMTMMMTTTDDYHHCGPRVRYLAATTIIYLDFGAVLHAPSLSLSLSLYFLSFHYMKHNEAAPGKSNYLYEPTFSLRVICQPVRSRDRYYRIHRN